MLSYGLNRYPFVGWNPMGSIHVHRNNQKCSDKPKLSQRTDILPIAHILPLAYGARKILLNSQILSCKKNSIGYSSDFIVPLITKFTQTWPFFNCGYENLRRFDMQISWRWHGQRSLGKALILFLCPHLRLKMLISVYIIEQFSAVT